MRISTLGVGLLLGLVITAFDAPVALAGDYCPQPTVDGEPGEYPVSVRCHSGIVETAITMLGEADGVRVTHVPDGAPKTGDQTHGVSLPSLLIGLGLGAVAGTGAIVLREGRR